MRHWHEQFPSPDRRFHDWVSTVDHCRARGDEHGGLHFSQWTAWPPATPIDVCNVGAVHFSTDRADLHWADHNSLLAANDSLKLARLQRSTACSDSDASDGPRSLWTDLGRRMRAINGPKPPLMSRANSSLRQGRAKAHCRRHDKSHRRRSGLRGVFA